MKRATLHFISSIDGIILAVFFMIGYHNMPQDIFNLQLAVFCVISAISCIVAGIATLKCRNSLFYKITSIISCVSLVCTLPLLMFFAFCMVVIVGNSILALLY